MVNKNFINLYLTDDEVKQLNNFIIKYVPNNCTSRNKIVRCLVKKGMQYVIDYCNNNSI